MRGICRSNKPQKHRRQNVLQNPELKPVAWELKNKQDRQYQ